MRVNSLYTAKVGGQLWTMINDCGHDDNNNNLIMITIIKIIVS